MLGGVELFGRGTLRLHHDCYKYSFDQFTTAPQLYIGQAYANAKEHDSQVFLTSNDYHSGTDLGRLQATIDELRVKLADLQTLTIPRSGFR